MRLLSRLLRPVDMLFNWWKGDPEETISATMGRLRKEDHDPVARWVCRVLDWIERDHCAGAYANEGKTHLTPKEAVDKILTGG